MPAYVCSCVCACLSSGGSCACRCSVCERERYQPQRLALKQTLPIQFETRYRLGICACVFHCFPPIWFIFIIIFLFFSEIKNIFNLWKRKRTSFWLFTPYIHLIFVSNVNEWRVFIKFKNWLLEFHIIASRLYSKSTKIFSLHEIRGKKNPITVRIISTSLVHSKGEPGHKNENNLQWMKTDIYQSCLSIIQHFLVFEMRALNNARMKLVCEVISCWN